jgi:hypothetical protein
VRAINDVPIRGYVAIYFTTSDDRIDMHRIRAEDGIASCELSRRARGYTIGAVIEDEGLILEAFVDAETDQDRDRFVFLSCSSRDRVLVRGIAKQLTTAGLGVFFDESSLEPGNPLNAATRNQIDRASLFVAFISQATETTSHPFLWAEWEYAAEKHRQESELPFILAVALDPIRPQAAIVPELFHDIEWFPLYGRQSTLELVELITQRVGERERGAQAR